MSDKEDGDPRSVTHLRPKDMPHHQVTNVPHGPPGNSDIQLTDEIDLDDDDADLFYSLQALREPFPAEQIEKLPKPMWRDAWEDQPSRRCPECNGYHPSANTIHLDYIGHAGVTSRLLEVDPLWTWEPLALDANGLPKFDGFGGLWIKLTVCGVTRLGYGDATGRGSKTAAVKEIIGDAIRNAAMRFGVALDLWSKVDRHESKNPGADSSTRRSDVRRGSGGDRGQRETQDSSLGQGGAAVASDAPRPGNQDALDELASICDDHGYSTEYAKERFARLNGGQHISQGSPENIRALGRTLIHEATADPDQTTEAAEVGGPDGGSTGDGSAAESAGEPLF